MNQRKGKKNFLIQKNCNIFWDVVKVRQLWIEQSYGYCKENFDFRKMREMMK